MQARSLIVIRVIMVLVLMTLELGCQGNESDGADPVRGVTLTLAEERARTIKNLRYDLSLDIPAAPTEPIAGRVTIRFVTDGKRDASQPLVIDFAPGPDFVTSVATEGRELEFRVTNGHIVIPGSELTLGENTVDIVFRTGEASLNRNPDFLYTLFVPARAHLAFPCLDQPDLKARFTLELTVPANWQSVANGVEISRQTVRNRSRVRYAETPPIPTYLFAFAAGQFQVESEQREGRIYRMFHRETDVKKVERNRRAVFDLHASSLGWLENYTEIDYPFGKFDFVLIPSFQFSGMEHPGSIFYNASSILLDESATENQMLNRASLIAHETAHMWFGDLVTMRWFNDVWMKEVFANFMAAKIVNPAFPTVNHDLRFLVAHYPAAYAVDRTAGTHPIRQELTNLDEAGALYGPIIYQKAPIVMRQLERIVGAERFQEGLRAYLKQFEFGNATWLDLVRILDERTSVDLAAWSRAWVEEAGRPEIRTELELDAQGGLERLVFRQADPQEQRSLRWVQQMEVLLGTSAGIRSVPINFQTDLAELPTLDPVPSLKFVLPAGGGLAYGGFTLDSTTRAFLLDHLPDLSDPVARGAAWVTLWEEMLDRRIRPSDFLELALRALPRENTEQNVQLVLGYVDDAFWKFIPDSTRQELSSRLEGTLLSGLRRAVSSSLKSTYFTAFRSIVTTGDGVAFLERIWRRQEKVPGLTLAEEDEAAMALELAVRGVPDASEILQQQYQRFENPDRKARFEFVMPALSDSPETRDAWFDRLSEVSNRRREPWVLEGLRYLNHPLRSVNAEKYLRPALGMLQEIQATGDIFFPRNWMDATLNGHKSSSASEAVRAFLAEQTNYPVRLRRIILQAADDLFRATKILNTS